MRMTRDEVCPLMYYSGFRVLDSEENYIRMPNSWEGTIDKDRVAIFTGIRDCTMVFNDVLQRLFDPDRIGTVFRHDTDIA